MPDKETFISKYKPYYLADFCMDDKMMGIIRTLFEIDDLNTLFVGSSGSGKTTLLNAIAREYYGLTKNVNIPETNILFINNLKEQGINYYRNEMKTFCQSQCSIYGKKKMIIIDDLDSINEQSQQVFRNYIDKYKHNIHFVSVCSNIQKVIESIQSRIHIIKINPPGETEIRNIMEHIMEQEKIVLDKESCDYILQISNGSGRNGSGRNGSIRVLINYLEKFYIYGKPVDIHICKKMCSNISLQTFEDYITCLKEDRLKDAIDMLYSVYDYGYSVIDILDYFFTFVKSTGHLDETMKYNMIPYLCKYITIFNKLHEDVIELAFFTNGLYCIFREII